MIFDRQEYQQECISNIITLLEDFDFTKQDNLHACLKRFHQSHPMPVRTINEDKKNIDILMETGTGKTFTYLNLIFELNKVYKQNKFIIFVPRRAILESVKQNIELTKEYFSQIYSNKLKVSYYHGNAGAIPFDYIQNPDELSLLVLTNSAIDKGATNILNKYCERLHNLENPHGSKIPLEAIAQLNPISIIDEPHLLQGTQFNKYFQTIKSLYFRFGATFPKDKKAPEYHLSNMAYCLDSINAFRNYLVKQVHVHTITSSDFNGYTLKEIHGRGRSAQITFSHPDLKDLTFGINEDLHAIGRAGVVINNTEKGKPYLSDGTIIQKASYRLSQAEISHLLAKSIDLHFAKEESLFKQGIKALSLFFIPHISDFRDIRNNGEIDKPYINQEFERLYKLKRAEILSSKLDPKYRAYLERDFKADGTLGVHDGYFSGDATCKTIDDGIELILKKKQELLSFDTPLRFIFSVWALQEGWDNPNVFTITKLAPSTSENSAHQQVGRGLRLCVNQEGKRITHSHLDYDSTHFYSINHLDLVISSKEGDFIKNLQKDINDLSFTINTTTLALEDLKKLGLDEDLAFELFALLKRKQILSYDKEQKLYHINSPLANFLATSQEARELLGEQFDIVAQEFHPHANKAPQIINANKVKKITIRPTLAKQFKELWDTINQRARITYQNINEAELIQNIVQKFNENPIEKELIKHKKEVLDAQTNTIKLQEENSQDFHHHHDAHTISKYLIQLAEDETLPPSFLVKCYNAADKASFQNSPAKAFKKLADIIKGQIHASMVTSVDYDFSTHAFSPSALDDPLYHPDGSPRDSIPHSMLGRQVDDENPPAEHYLYESIVYDSEIERLVSQENTQTASDANNPHSIKVFAKLPPISIPTPYKSYNPDFAYLIESAQGDKIFFVCETKGYDDEQDIPEAERKKIDYAKKFFQALGENLKDKNIKVAFKTRINKQSLLDCLRGILNPTTKEK